MLLELEAPMQAALLGVWGLGFRVWGPLYSFLWVVDGSRGFYRIFEPSALIMFWKLFSMVFHKGLTLSVCWIWMFCRVRLLGS